LPTLPARDTDNSPARSRLDHSQSAIKKQTYGKNGKAQFDLKDRSGIDNIYYDHIEKRKNNLDIKTNTIVQKSNYKQ